METSVATASVSVSFPPSVADVITTQIENMCGSQVWMTVEERWNSLTDRWTGRDGGLLDGKPDEEKTENLLN